MVGLCGILLICAAIPAFSTASFTVDRVVVFVLLAIAAVTCSRFPIRIGVGAGFMTLDTVPLVMAVVLLPWHDAVLIGSMTVAATLIGEPGEAGWLGWYWRIQSVAAAATVMYVGTGLAALLLDMDDGPTQVLLLPALIVALAIETMFDLLYVVDEEARGTDGRLVFATFEARVVIGANVFLPAMATAVLTPYVDDLLRFALLFPALLLGICGALWVANSHHLEKRRGERLRDTFSRYVPEGVVDDNIETMQRVELGGEQREVSVLFCDIRGFTSWAEKRGATEVITELNVLLTELSASVMDAGGTLDKFTGDGLMAFWGAPVPVEDHADRACRAALDMLLRLDRVNAQRVADGQEAFAIGVGVHSGDAVVGNVGHERRLDYTAIGDTVNTAARLEAATKEIGKLLLVSRPTVDLLAEEMRDRAMRVGDIAVKGRQQPVEAWALRPLRPELDDIDDTFAA